ncbi:MAG: polysaccharide export protein [Deltaproteobacteria bacterium]|nr:polysaccharide export protein [Deltaproteobacteria bacterium]
MKREARVKSCIRLTLFVLAAALPLGCHPQVPRPVSLPPVIEANTLGVGDVFVLIIVGEDKLPTEYTVAPDGTVDIPYIHRVKVLGLEPQQVTDLVRQRLIDGQILTNPSVSVEIKAYNSKRVVIGGEVRNPGAMPLEPGMTLVRALSQAGGLTPIARKDGIVLRRNVEGKTRAVVVDYEAITHNQIPDVPLQSGDTIFVPQRAF